MIAAACDMRIATPQARFGVPIARTLGNCLSPYNVKRVVGHFGPDRASRMLIFAELLSAAEAQTCGFVARLVESQELETVVRELCDRVVTFAPLTMAAAKETMRRLAVARVADCDDIIRRVYGSADFREGVAAFIAKRRPIWRGK
jgi:enoyl-CoA hydratase/carnithine racemase